MRKYEQELSALYFTLDQYTKKVKEAYLPSDITMYTEWIEFTQEQINKRIVQLDAEKAEEEKDQFIDEQMEEYHILNMDESGRDFIEYEIPQSFEVTTFSSWKEANEYIKYLKDLNRDPSYMVSILGYYILDNEYIQVIHKIMVTY